MSMKRNPKRIRKSSKYFHGDYETNDVDLSFWNDGDEDPALSMKPIVLLERCEELQGRRRMKTGRFIPADDEFYEIKEEPMLDLDTPAERTVEDNEPPKISKNHLPEARSAVEGGSISTPSKPVGATKSSVPDATSNSAALKASFKIFQPVKNGATVTSGTMMVDPLSRKVVAAASPPKEGIKILRRKVYDWVPDPDDPIDKILLSNGSAEEKRVAIIASELMMTDGQRYKLVELLGEAHREERELRQEEERRQPEPQFHPKSKEKKRPPQSQQSSLPKLPPLQQLLPKLPLPQPKKPSQQPKQLSQHSKQPPQQQRLLEEGRGPLDSGQQSPSSKQPMSTTISDPPSPVKRRNLGHSFTAIVWKPVECDSLLGFEDSEERSLVGVEGLTMLLSDVMGKHVDSCPLSAKDDSTKFLLREQSFADLTIGVTACCLRCQFEKKFHFKLKTGQIEQLSVGGGKATKS